jgi:hypothetical protein
MARGGEGRTVRPVGTQPRPAVTSQSGRQAMNLMAPQMN